MTQTPTRPERSGLAGVPLSLEPLNRKDFTSDQEVRWCPGCGDYSILAQMRKALTTVVDDSALRFATVMVSAGRRGLQVELPPADLVRLTRARTAPIGR